MSHRRDHQTSSPKLDVKLNPSPTPPGSPEPESPMSSASPLSSESSSEMSIDGSCVSSEAEEDQTMSNCSPADQSSNNIRASPMALVGCPRCLMYVMLSDTNPKCPKCKSTVLLDFLNEEANKKTGT